MVPMKTAPTLAGVFAGLLAASCAGSRDDIASLKEARLTVMGKGGATVAQFVEAFIEARSEIAWSASPHAQRQDLRWLCAVAHVPRLVDGVTDTLEFRFVVDARRSVPQAELYSVAINGTEGRWPWEAVMVIGAWRLETVFGQPSAAEATRRDLDRARGRRLLTECASTPRR